MTPGYLISCDPDSAKNGLRDSRYDYTDIVFLNMLSAGLALDHFHFAVYIRLNISGIRGDRSGSVSRIDSHPDSRI